MNNVGQEVLYNKINQRMETTKKIGVWMDHSVAHLMKLTNETIVASTIKLESSLPAKEQNLGIHERLFHDKEQRQLSAYFKRVSDVLKDYNEVILFGPTDARTELLNLLKADHHFNNVKIGVRAADKMTENQQHAFVKEYFKGTK